MKKSKLLKEIQAEFIIEERGGSWRVCYHFPEEEGGEVGAPIGCGLAAGGMDRFSEPGTLDWPAVRDVGLEIKSKLNEGAGLRVPDDLGGDVAEDFAVCAGVLLDPTCRFVGNDYEGLWFASQRDAKRAYKAASEALFAHRHPELVEPSTSVPSLDDRSLEQRNQELEQRCEQLEIANKELTRWLELTKQRLAALIEMAPIIPENDIGNVLPEDT